jgi:hypothetical protein
VGPDSNPGSPAPTSTLFSLCQSPAPVVRGTAITDVGWTFWGSSDGRRGWEQLIQCKKLKIPEERGRKPGQGGSLHSLTAWVCFHFSIDSPLRTESPFPMSPHYKGPGDVLELKARDRGRSQSESSLPHASHSVTAICMQAAPTLSFMQAWTVLVGATTLCEPCVLLLLPG